jgi:hypothetical protein
MPFFLLAVLLVLAIVVILFAVYSVVRRWLWHRILLAGNSRTSPGVLPYDEAGTINCERVDAPLATGREAL